MKHLLDLREIYINELIQSNNKFNEEKEQLYYCMKDFVAIMEKEMNIKEKLENLEQEMLAKFDEKQNE